MKLVEFKREFEEILMMESGSITEDTVLNELPDWDSLSKVSLAVMLEEKFELKLTNEEISTFHTFFDIRNALGDRIEK